MFSGCYKTSNIRDNYIVDKLIGEGSFAVVHKAYDKKTNEERAIKVIDKQGIQRATIRTSLESDDQMGLQSEIEILSQVMVWFTDKIDHPNIVKLYEVYDEKTRLYMVMEMMTGGELFDRIVEKESYNEKEACEVLKPIVDAISYCHSMGVAHRDLKPENLLYSTVDPDASIKIADFGLAKVISNEQLMTTACGSPSYIAPEILSGQGYTVAVDYWSIGIIMYVLLCGYPPFYEESNDKLFSLIKKGQFEFPSPQWDQISDQAKDLIKNLLQVDPKKRFDANKIMQHSWMKGQTSEKTLNDVTERMRSYNAKRRFRVVFDLHRQASSIYDNRYKQIETFDNEEMKESVMKIGNQSFWFQTIIILEKICILIFGRLWTFYVNTLKCVNLFQKAFEVILRILEINLLWEHIFEVLRRKGQVCRGSMFREI